MYFGSWDGSVYALTSVGNLKWRYVTGSVVESSPILDANGILYVGSNDGYFYAIVCYSGTLKWSPIFLRGFVWSIPVLNTYETVVYISSSIEYLYAINTSTGVIKWKYSIFGSLPISVAIGPDGTLYVPSVDNNILAINPEGTVLWEYFSTSFAVASSPVVGLDGTLFVASNDQKVYALSLIHI